MTSLETLLLDLAEQLPDGAGGPDEGMGLTVTAVEVDVPIESRLEPGRFGATLPRGRWKAGFDLPHGQLYARFARVDQSGGGPVGLRPTAEPEVRR
jgi:hypothetical protein